MWDGRGGTISIGLTLFLEGGPLFSLKSSHWVKGVV